MGRSRVPIAPWPKHEQYQIDVKRMTVPEDRIPTVPCTLCGHDQMVHDGDYLPFPVLGKPEAREVECDNCGQPLYVTILLTLEMSVISPAKATGKE